MIASQSFCPKRSGSYTGFLHVPEYNALIKKVRRILRCRRGPPRDHRRRAPSGRRLNQPRVRRAQESTEPFSTCVPASILVRWRVASALACEAQKPYLLALRDYVQRERASKTVYPPSNEVLAALEASPLSQIKVVIVESGPKWSVGRAAAAPRVYSAETRKWFLACFSATVVRTLQIRPVGSDQEVGELGVLRCASETGTGTGTGTGPHEHDPIHLQKYSCISKRQAHLACCTPHT